MLAKSKLNSIETISQALIDMDISHKEFVTILKEKEVKMKNMKLWDWVVWNQRFKWKIIEYFMSSKKLFFSCVCIKWLTLPKKHLKTMT